jgi:serine/threonine-protein kinase
MLQLPLTIEGRYRLEAAIASGGFATVYLGTQLAMQRQVAIKLITPPAGADTWTRRAEREAIVLGRLKHPATVSVFDYGMWQGSLYLVMEYVEGKTLHNHLREQGPMLWSQAVRIALDILGALDEAHRIGVLHRDLKPANIMIAPDTRGKLRGRVLDFGIAALLPSAEQLPAEVDGAPITQDGFVGTPRYASPEQLCGQPLTPASDLYAVGLILWEILTGKPAVPSNKLEACLQAHLGQQPWLLPPVEAPPAFIALIERALDKDPAKRWPDAASMIQALELIRSDTSADMSLRSQELRTFSAPIIDPNLQDEAPPLLLDAGPAPQARRVEPPRQLDAPRIDNAPRRVANAPPAAFSSSDLLLPAEPITPRRSAPPQAPVADPVTTRRLGLALFLMAAVAVSVVPYAKHRNDAAAAQRAAIEADKPAILTLPPVPPPKMPSLESIDGMIAALEAADWQLKLRDSPTRLGSLEVQEVTLTRAGAEIKLIVASSASRDQLDEYLNPSRKDTILYSGIYGIKIVGTNSAGRRITGEVLGRLELWRATIERERAQKP